MMTVPAAFLTLLCIVIYPMKTMLTRALASLSRHGKIDFQQKWLSVNVNAKEVEKFSRDAADWWEKSAVLLKSNAVRVPYIRDNIKKVSGMKSLSNVTIADIGCGGGFLSEALARSGAKVTGVDPSEKMIAVAKGHQLLDPSIIRNLEYKNCAIDDLVNEGKTFDAVVASEVVEHVADLGDFLSKLSKSVKPGGSLFITTINRTTMSYWLAIVAAEQLLRIVPSGTHDWEQFVTPNELQTILEKHNMSLQSIQGTALNPITQQWRFTSSTDVNYMAHFTKMK